MSRRFQYDGNAWEVEHLGFGEGAGRRATHFHVDFSPSSTPTRKAIRGFVSALNLDRISDDALRTSLRRALRPGKN